MENQSTPISDKQGPKTKNIFKTTTVILAVIVLALGGLSVWLLLDNIAKNDVIAANETQKTTDHNCKTPTIIDNTADTPLANTIKQLPNNEAVGQLFAQFIGGYWSVLDEEFVAFIYENSIPRFEYGIWETSFGNNGKVTDSKALGEYEIELTVYFPAVPASMIDDGRPEKTEKVTVDMKKFNDVGSIRVKIAEGEWKQYEFVGHTSTDY